MNFGDRDIVVTGGTGALGSAVVGALLDKGARVHVPWRTPAERDRFPHGKHERVRMVEAELVDEAAVARLYQDTGKLWASLHLAGGFAMAPIGEADRAEFLAQIETNLLSCYLCCRAAVAAMRRNGDGGRIVNVTARAGIEPRHGAGMTAYATAKAAVAALTQALAAETVDDGILINAVAPATMDTPANRAAMPKADFAKWAPLGDVAATILFLASPENRVTRGAIVPVYGRS
jgi:NAD(P)-dependent dehydrogenase (short-subunit alcohol dehydrogenase family)